MKDLIVKVTGEISQSNFGEYSKDVLAKIEDVKTELVTDRDFVDAEKIVKICKAAEDKISLAKGYAMEEAADINALFCAMDEVSGKLRETRLSLNRQIKSEKESRKAAIIKGGSDAVKEFMSLQHEAVKKMDVDYRVFTDVAKGKRNLISMQKSVDAASAELIGNIQNTAEKVENNLAVFESIAVGHAALFPDRDKLLLASESELVAIVDGRKAKAELELKDRQEAEERAEKERKEAAAKAEKQQAVTQVEYPPLESANEGKADPVSPNKQRYVMTVTIDSTREQARDMANAVYSLIVESEFGGVVVAVNLDKEM